MADTYFNASSKISSARKFAPWQSIADDSITGDTVFQVAADRWLSLLGPTEAVGDMPIARRTIGRRIRKNTTRSYSQYIVNLKLFFGGMLLKDIRLDHIRAYEDARLIGAEPFIRKIRPNKNVEVGPCPANARRINYEVQLLKRILRVAKLWGAEECQLHTSLTVDETEVSRALSRSDQQLWLKVAASHPRWEVVYWYSTLAFATCMGTNEIRALRIGDVNLDSGIINIPWAGSKNVYRHRSVSIGNASDETYQAIAWLLERAQSLGSRDREHYVFPFRENPFPFDPTRPMSISGIRKQWDEVRLASGLNWFRPYDLRHTAITRLAEENIPIATIMDMAGHISAKMTEALHAHLGRPQGRGNQAGAPEHLGRREALRSKL